MPADDLQSENGLLKKAICGAGAVDPETFFDPAREREAQAICNRCPVMQRCLTYALENNEIHGVWGGLTESQRAQLKTAKLKTQSRKAI